jgi:hypothetical protein
MAAIKLLLQYKTAISAYPFVEAKCTKKKHRELNIALKQAKSLSVLNATRKRVLTRDRRTIYIH